MLITGSALCRVNAVVTDEVCEVRSCTWREAVTPKEPLGQRCGLQCGPTTLCLPKGLARLQVPGGRLVSPELSHTQQSLPIGPQGHPAHTFSPRRLGQALPLRPS